MSARVRNLLQNLIRLPSILAIHFNYLAIRTDYRRTQGVNNLLLS